MCCLRLFCFFFSSETHLHLTCCNFLNLPRCYRLQMQIGHHQRQVRIGLILLFGMEVENLLVWNCLLSSFFSYSFLRYVSHSGCAHFFHSDYSPSLPQWLENTTRGPLRRLTVWVPHLFNTVETNKWLLFDNIVFALSLLFFCTDHFLFHLLLLYEQCENEKR